MRLFVALDLPAEVRAALPLPGDGWRTLPKESLHVTLAFLGERAAAEPVIEAVRGAMRPVGELTLRPAVLLPPRRPRVMAVPLAGDVSALQGAVAGALGVVERRPFLAHVTVGRARGRVGRELPEVPSLSFRARTVSVYRSHPGSRYEALAVFDVPESSPS